jgi:hypothetical protein
LFEQNHYRKMGGIGDNGYQHKKTWGKVITGSNFLF